MHAMQYEITLPADHDMDVIRHRVATRGTATDEFPHLGAKVYGIRERGVDGSLVNQYAPFYLWTHGAGMGEFLFGPPFANILRDFGRPVVRHWTGAGFARGPAAAAEPRAASRSSAALPPDVPLADAVATAVERLAELATRDGVHSAAALVDPATWELVTYTLWAEAAPEDAGVRYRVLHLSRPRFADLPAGRAW